VLNLTGLVVVTYRSKSRKRKMATLVHRGVDKDRKRLRVGFLMSAFGEF